MEKQKTMITFSELNLYTWGGILAIFATYFLIQKGAVENAKKNFKDVKTTIKLSKEELIEHINNLDRNSKVELIKSLQPEFNKVIDEIGISKDQVIEHAQKLDKESRKFLFNKLSPEFEDVKKEINLSKEKIIEEVGKLDKQSREQIFNHIKPEFESVKEAIKLSKEELYKQIKDLDENSKNEILKIIQPKLEFIEAATQTQKLDDGNILTKIFFQVPNKSAVPRTDIFISCGEAIEKANIARVKMPNRNRSSVNLNIGEKGNEIHIPVYDIGMNEHFELELYSKKNLNCQVITK